MNNYNTDSVAKICRAAQNGKASAVEVVCDKKMYDYGGCPYPEGIIESNFAVGFNHDKIEEVIHLGYVDEDAKKLKQALLDSENEIKEKFAESE